jgi:hypothetical protein
MAEEIERIQLSKLERENMIVFLSFLENEEIKNSLSLNFNEI